MPDAETHRQARAIQKAKRNAGRRKRRANPIVVSWGPRPAHRCLMCGRWIGVGAEAGHGDGFTYCEPCFLGRELRVASMRALTAMRTVVLSGAA